jgi:hypothetical protein
MYAALLATILGTWKCTDAIGNRGDGVFTFAANGHGSFSGEGFTTPTEFSIQGQTLTIHYVRSSVREKVGFTLDGNQLIIEPELTYVDGDWTVNPSVERLMCVRVKTRES